MPAHPLTGRTERNAVHNVTPVLGDQQMIISVAEDISIPMAVITPLGGRAGVICGV
jgi:hypothetical protein